MSKLQPDDEQSLLRSVGYSPETSSTPASPPTFPPPNSTRMYQKMDPSPNQHNDPAPRYSSPVSASSNFETFEGSAGLGIVQRPQFIQRVPVGSRLSSSNPFPPSSSTSSPHTPGFSSPSEITYVRSPPTTLRPVDEEDITKGKNIFSESPESPFVTVDEVPRGTPMNGTPMSMNNESDNDNDNLRPFADRYHPMSGCPAKRDIHSHRYSWLSISILMLSIYSTTFSGIWLMLAIIQPRYGRAIHSGGKLSPSTASIIFALFAKTIELSFVTVFITFLGQVLSRRSLVKSSRGVTISEMTMRTWVIQPGFMITHYQNLQHAGLTFLGLISLTAALVSMFYTTASDAIVSPQLRFGKTENIQMYGLVKTSYANPIYTRGNCKTPIALDVDGENAGLTCLSYEHAGESYHNAISFMGTWASINANGTGVSTDIAKRPAAPGMLFDNTTVVGAWVATETSNLTLAYERYSRIVNNVTLSMPHAGLFAAARAAKNGILQPEELAGVGEYNVEAAVVSPTLNVLCANMNEKEIAPLVYTSWPHARLAPNSTMAWSGYQNEIQLLPGHDYLNSTVVDDIFEWGPNKVQPPVFPMYPIEYNSITNNTVVQSDSVYMLIKAPNTTTTNFTVCRLRSYLSTSCSSFYNVSGIGGGRLEAHCDPGNKLAYDKSVIAPPEKWETDWRNVAQAWILALSLNTGISNANSSTSRLLAQLIPAEPGWGAVKLNSLTPSIAELMAVMAGNTLLLSSVDATFRHYWDYPKHILDPGDWEPFNASISSQQYTSGMQQQWQGIFYVVLLLVFVTNIFCLCYFILRHGLVTDFTEPSNLFALAVNSPPSHRLEGSCGVGPEGGQLDVDWHVMAESTSGHFFIREGEQGLRDNEGVKLRRRTTQNLKSIASYSKLSAKRASFL